MVAGTSVDYIPSNIALSLRVWKKTCQTHIWLIAIAIDGHELKLLIVFLSGLRLRDLKPYLSDDGH